MQVCLKLKTHFQTAGLRLSRQMNFCGLPNEPSAMSPLQDDVCLIALGLNFKHTFILFSSLVKKLLLSPLRSHLISEEQNLYRARMLIDVI